MVATRCASAASSAWDAAGHTRSLGSSAASSSSSPISVATSWILHRPQWCTTAAWLGVGVGVGLGLGSGLGLGLAEG